MLLLPYVHRYPMTLLSTLTQKILNVKVREELPTPIQLAAHSYNPHARAQTPSHGPNSLSLYPFSACLRLVRCPAPGPASAHPTNPNPVTIQFSYLLMNLGVEKRLVTLL